MKECYKSIGLIIFIVLFGVGIFLPFWYVDKALLSLLWWLCPTIILLILLIRLIHSREDCLSFLLIDLAKIIAGIIGGLLSYEFTMRLGDGTKTNNLSAIDTVYVGVASVIVCGICICLAVLQFAVVDVARGVYEIKRENCDLKLPCSIYFLDCSRPSRIFGALLTYFLYFLFGFGIGIFFAILNLLRSGESFYCRNILTTTIIYCIIFIEYVIMIFVFVKPGQIYQWVRNWLQRMETCKEECKKECVKKPTGMVKSLLLIGIIVVIGFIILLKSSPSAKRKGAITILRSADSVTLDPAKAMDLESIRVIDNIYEPLVRFYEDATPSPCLIEGFEKKGNEYKFLLRDDIYFHNGKRLTSDDVVYTFQRFQDIKTPSFWKALHMDEIISEVSKVDERTVIIKLHNPYEPFLKLLSLSFLNIVHSNLSFKEEGSPAEIIGTGPFMFSEWRRNDFIKIVPNPNYRKGKPPMKEVIFKVVPNAFTRVMSVHKGEADIALDIDVDSLKILPKKTDAKVVSKEGHNVVYIAINTKRSPFDRKEVRKAISLAMNRKEFVDIVLEGYGVTLSTIIPPSILFKNSIPELPESLDDAKKIFDELKLGEREFSLLTIPKFEQFAQIVQGFLSKAGLRIKINSYETGLAVKMLQSGEFDLALIRYQGLFPDPDAFLTPLLSCKAIGFSNFSFWCNNEFDQIISQASRAKLEERIKLYEKAIRILQEEYPVVPLFSMKEIVLLNKRIRNYRLLGGGRILVYDP